MEKYRVVSVLPLGKKKYKVTVEGTEIVVFSLYPSEIKRYSISEGTEITESLYNEIMDILQKRGRERALYYLKSSDKTSFQIRTKLKEGLYPEKIIDKVLVFLEKYGYIDDFRFVENYIMYNVKRKSRERIKNDLRLKGISREVIEDVMEEQCVHYNDFEREQIEKVCIVKIKDFTDEKQVNKVTMSLMRKGYKYDTVRSVIKAIQQETTT